MPTLLWRMDATDAYDAPPDENQHDDCDSDNVDGDMDGREEHDTDGRRQGAAKRRKTARGRGRGVGCGGMRARGRGRASGRAAVDIDESFAQGLLDAADVGAECISGELAPDKGADQYGDSVDKHIEQEIRRFQTTVAAVNIEPDAVAPELPAHERQELESMPLHTHNSHN